MKNNLIAEQLHELGIIDPENVIEFHNGVRDNEGIIVMQCPASGVLYLSNASHVDNAYYNEKEGVSYWGDKNRQTLLQETYEDDSRRFSQFKEVLSGKKYLDVGTGLGGMMDLAKKDVAAIAGIELQNEIREELVSLGYKMYESSASIPQNESFDVVSLFHVFEHMLDPLKELKNLSNNIVQGGKIIIEVPHAKDALISIYNLDSFKKFTFWSEHLILHTRNSLNVFLSKAGFCNISIKGYQRYPLANHLWWLLKGEPGGQKKLSQLRSEELDEAYLNLLDKLDATDTLIAIAEKC